jgi:uncharacterized membrane protein
MSKGRLEALTDGIFATVMTVLVLSLSVPIIAGSATPNNVPSVINSELDQLVPIVYGYVLSFLILAVFWIRHHNIFHFISRVDGPFLWLNLLFLLTIGFIPFSTELLGRFPQIEETVIIYGANLAATGICLQALWRYAVRRKLVASDGRLDENLMGRINRNLTVGPFLYFSAILLAFVRPLISDIIYAGVLVFYVLVTSNAIRFRRRANLPNPR